MMWQLLMKKTALDIIRHINQEIEGSTVSPELVLYDMHMMGFKVKTHLGSSFTIHAPTFDVIHAIWKLVKADSIISESLDDLVEEEQETVLQYFSTMEQRLSQTLDHMIDTSFEKSTPAGRIKFEIFKDLLSEKKVN